ncbi:MAG: ATP-binding protein [Solirubrobacteraceae bacterium]
MSAVLLGRDAELDVLRSALQGVAACGLALVVRGDAGIGKSALLEAASAEALEQGIVVIGTTGVQAEGDLPFACLHQLLRPVLGQVGDLPQTQQAAIATAFGAAEGSAPELFLIALATLQLLSDAAARRPLALIVEDAHWLDRPSADALAFVARRLASDPIVMFVAIRDGYESPLLNAHLSEMVLHPLAEPEARKLIRIRHQDLAPSVSSRLLNDARGNPLAILELPTALESGARGGSVPLPVHLPVTARLESAFASKAEGLPGHTRTLLLVAALEDQGQLAEILQAAEVVAGSPVTVADLDPAVSAGLVRLDGPTLRFRHPLVRSALHHAAHVAELHAAHAAIAQVLASEPDRSIWHRAAAVIGVDPEVAAGLEEAGRRADMRGAVETAAIAFERAAAVAGDPQRRGSLLLGAATKAAELGRTATMRRLVVEAESLPLGEREKARAIWLNELLDTGPAGDPARVDRLVTTAGRAAGAGEVDLALQLLATAAFHCYWGDLGDREASDVLHQTEGLGLDRGDPRLLQIEAYAAPLERGAEVSARLRETVLPRSGEDLYLLGTAASHAGWFDEAVALLGRSAARLRESGRLGRLAQVLQTQAWSAIFTSNYAVAMPAAEEADRLASETGQPLWQTGARIAEAMLAGLRGEADVVAELTAGAERVALPSQVAGLLALVQYARGLSALGLGQPEKAYEYLHRLTEPGDPSRHTLVFSYAIGDFAEAATRIGRTDPAREEVRRLEPLAGPSASPWFRIAFTFARAQLAADADAEEVYRDALSEEPHAWPFMRARLQLSFGEWLRRHRKVAAARPQLRQARDAFDALGVRAWGERARQELRASGESSQRLPATLEELTAQELQIAQMAADRLSNREIGERLFLSHRTVESHLYRVFPKLGITSRGQLTEALISTRSPSLPAALSDNTEDPTPTPVTSQ